jgi:hypothetical protein
MSDETSELSTIVKTLTTQSGPFHSTVEAKTVASMLSTIESRLTVIMVLMLLSALGSVIAAIVLLTHN